MELIDRYLQAASRYLPAAQRQDILNEMRANILSAMDDREAQLGRPLTEDEQIAVLQQQGNPTVVASRYRQDSGGNFSFGPVIIGPAVFPFYVRILALNLFLTFTVASIVHTYIEGHTSFGALLLPAVTQFFVVTAIFAAIHASQTKYGILDRWNPRALPPVRDPLLIPRVATLFEIFFTSIFILIWLQFPGAAHAVAYMFVGPVASYFTSPNSHPLLVTPAFQLFYLPLLLIMLVSLAQSGLNFAFPRWTRSRLIAKVAIAMLGLLLVFGLFRAGDFLELNPATATPGYQALVNIINKLMHLSFLISVIITTLQIGWQIRRILRLTPAPTRGSSASLAV